MMLATKSADTTDHMVARLVDQWAILLKTEKRDGTWVGTPVNLAVDADRAYFGTPVNAGKVKRLLSDFEPAPLPIHIVYPHARLLSSNVRAFVDMAVGRLRR